MSDFADLLITAQQEFGLYSPDQRLGQWNEHYVEFAARLSLNSVSQDRYSEKYTRLPSPCSFLTGLPPRPDELTFSQDERTPGSISVVVGEYGLGKTELMYHIAERLLENAPETGFNCLPVRLGSCGAHLRQLVERSQPTAFLGALLSHIPGFPAEGLQEALLNDLVVALRAGVLVLVLDALDELILESSHHSMFLENLACLLALPSLPNKVNAVLSVRLEYLRNLDPEGKKTARALAGRSRPVNFLVLDFFDDSTVSDYMTRRIGGEHEVFVRKLKPYRKLRDVLRRPLMARILCDVITDPGRGPETYAKLIKRISSIDHPAQLLELFTESVGVDNVLLDDQAVLQKAIGSRGRTYRWDNDRLAEESLDAFRHGKHHLDKDGIERVLGVPPTDDPQTLAMMAHKCPFLALRLEEDGLSANFTHRVFEEYFVTKGIVDELAKSGSGRERGAAGKARSRSGFASFHDLVLNIDMHRFLRELTVSTLGQKRWYEETGVAYGLSPESSAEWDPPLTPGQLKGLNGIRKDLLDVRSALPKRKKPDALLVDQYLELEGVGTILARKLGRQKLTPRYQVPNYEAVAVCLLEPDVYTSERMEKFSTLLRQRMAHAVEFLLDAAAEHPLRVPYELLVERILDIGRRSDWRWVHQWSPQDVVTVASPERPNAIVIRSEAGCRNRVIAILQQLKDAKEFTPN